jgi:competence transcription factor ComK
MDIIFRKAKISDTVNLEKLIEKSAKFINSAYYSQIEIDAAL